MGFKEVLENPEKVQIEEKIVNIPPLPGMLVLKYRLRNNCYMSPYFLCFVKEYCYMIFQPVNGIIVPMNCSNSDS